MFFEGISPHLVSLLVLTTLTVSAWADDVGVKFNITVEVKRNNMSIAWDKELSDEKSKKFQEVSLAVKTQLEKDLKDLPSVSQIKVKSFMEKQGNTFCEFECRVNSTNVTKYVIEKTLNMTIDIGAAKGTGVEKSQPQQSQDQKDEPPVGVIVFAALIMGAVTLAFLVLVLYRNWKSAKEHAPEASFESYREKKHRIPPTLVTEQPDITPPSYRRTDSIILEVDE